MSKLKFILFSVSYFLLFTLKSQQIEWINTYELGGREVNFSIDYSQKENQYIYIYIPQELMFHQFLVNLITWGILHI